MSIIINGEPHCEVSPCTNMIPMTNAKGDPVRLSQRKIKKTCGSYHCRGKLKMQQLVKIRDRALIAEVYELFYKYRGVS